MKTHCSHPVFMPQPVHRQTPFTKRQAGPLEEGPCSIALNIYNKFSSKPFPKEAMMSFTKMAMHWEKGNTQIVQTLLDTVSELMLILKDPKYL